jgi:ribosome-associated protein
MPRQAPSTARQMSARESVALMTSAIFIVPPRPSGGDRDYSRAMSEPIRIGRGIMVPAAALSWRAVRSSGPGGQNVNKVASKVELRLDLERVHGLAPAARARLERVCAPRLAADGRLLVTSQRTRDQARNLEDARDKVRRLIENALREPKRRHATVPSPAARDRRVRTKKRAAERKRARARVGTEDD